MSDLRQVTIDSPEFKKIKIEALLTNEEYLLIQLHRIKNSSVKKVRLVQDFEDIMKLASQRKLASQENNQIRTDDVTYIILNKKLWQLFHPPVENSETKQND